jgi:hypothetical protein
VPGGGVKGKEEVEVDAGWVKSGWRRWVEV